MSSVKKYFKARMVMEEIESYYKQDFNKKTRKPKNMASRALFYYIAYHKVGMNDREIHEFLSQERLGCPKRCSITIARNKFDLYLQQFPYLNDIYCKYFGKKTKGDDVDQRIIQEVKGLDADRSQEILDLIILRKKSWEWKSKDRVEIINCQL